jgi:hypothetical protein
MFVGSIAFFVIGTIFSEAGKRVGGFNLGTLMGGMAYFLMLICLLGFAYNLISYITKSAQEKNEN